MSQELNFQVGSTYICRNGSTIRITEIDVGPLSTYITGHPINEPTKLLFWRGNGNSMISEDWDLTKLEDENWRYESSNKETD